MEDVDDRVREAMRALDERGSIADDFAAKVDARLARGDTMDTSSTHDDVADGVPPRMTGTGDDSGLHDIKALAKTTRQRVSRRNTSQHDIDEQLLSASHSGLHMVALPEPAKVVSLPSIEEIAAAPATADAVVRAAHKVARAEHAPTRRRAVWIGSAVAAAAAIVIGVIVVKNGSKKDDQVSTMSAAEPQRPREAAATPTAKQSEHENGAANAAVGAFDTQQQAPGAGSGSAMAMGSGSAAASGSAAGSAIESVTTTGITGTDTPAHHNPKGTAPTTTGKLHTDGAGNGVGSGSSATKVDVKKDGKGKKPAPGGGAKSLDDLIDEAAGGSNDQKKPPTDNTKPTIDKKELTSSDIRTAMGSVAKRAQACYDKFNQAGTVGVKASVAPSGQITKVTITGAFAGTPTGECVASVVSGVSFPAWDGAPMTVNYSYLLSE